MVGGAPAIVAHLDEGILLDQIIAQLQRLTRVDGTITRESFLAVYEHLQHLHNAPSKREVENLLAASPALNTADGSLHMEDFVRWVFDAPVSQAVEVGGACKTTEDQGCGGWGNDIGDPLRGLSIHFLCSEFLRLMDVGEGSSSKVYDIEGKIRLLSKDTICPHDGLLGSAFVDAARDAHAGKATIMLSYCWGYDVRTITTALAHYCSTHHLEQRNVTVWMCITCINQHRVKKKQEEGNDVTFSEFEAAFGSRVRNIRHVVALLSPWQKPLSLTRVWCVYEAYVAITEDVKLEFALPPGEAESFQGNMEKLKWQELQEVIARLDIEGAKHPRKLIA